MSHGFGLLVLIVVGCGTSNAFIGKIQQPSIPTHSRHTAATMCSPVPEGKLVSLSETPLARRSFLAASLASAISVQRVGAAEDAEDAAEGDATEVVVKGELRLEKGSDQKLQKAGGKGRAEVVLRCVGKGIISKTTEDISLDDFPVSSMIHILIMATCDFSSVAADCCLRVWCAGRGKARCRRRIWRSPFRRDRWRYLTWRELDSGPTASKRGAQLSGSICMLRNLRMILTSARAVVNIRTHIILSRRPRRQNRQGPHSEPRAVGR